MMSRTTQGFYPWERTKNALLLKDDVGRSKPSAYDLPHQQFIYGKPLPRDTEGARDVTMTWKYCKQTQDKQPERDFRKLNKLSVNNGLHRSTQFSDFRRSTDARVKIKKGRNALPIYIPEEDFRYGRVNRPSTPIHLIVGNCYGTEQEMRQSDIYKYQAETAHFNKPRLLPRGNKASVLSYTHTREKLNSYDQNRKGAQDNQFKLTKFKGVAPRTNTYNDPYAKSLAKTQDIPRRPSQQSQQSQQNQQQKYQNDNASERSSQRSQKSYGSQQQKANELVGEDQHYNDY